MGPSEEAMALADFLIAYFGLSVDRHRLAYAIMEHELTAALAQQPAPSAPVGVDNPADTDSGIDGDWYCERHPWALQGHDGCDGAGLPACARIDMLCHIIRMRDQELRERDQQYGFLADRALAQQPAAFDFTAHLHRQRGWSIKTFGPGSRTTGLLDHIRKELREIEAAPHDGEEWIDVVILALDGAWRVGLPPEQIVQTLADKQAKNEGRAWPDWRTSDPDKAIEHDRTGEQPATDQGLRYDDVPGSWDRQSEGWPAIHDPDGKVRELVIREKLVPYGSYVTVGDMLRLKRADYVDKVLAAQPQGEG